MRSAVPTTASDPAELLRRPDKPLPYRPWLRLADALAGRRDGRRSLAGHLAGHRLEPDQTSWLRRNTNHFHERVHAEAVRYHALALDLHQEADRLNGQIKDTKRALAAARAALGELPTSPAEPTARRVTETHTPTQVVTTRRAREHQSNVLAPARARVTTAENTLEDLRTQRRTVRARLAALDQVHARRTARLEEHHARRGHTYERAYLTTQRIAPAKPAPTRAGAVAQEPTRGIGPAGETPPTGSPV